MKYLLGLDIGSSSIKASLVQAEDGVQVATAQSPAHELTIDAPQPGFAEQDPEIWWEHALDAIAMIGKETGALQEVAAIGISYQMHGLVVVDSDMKVLRPSIIWCDSRAGAFGDGAAEKLGRDFCQQHLLNDPGNFTAAKLAWVKAHQPDLYQKIYKFMLPGDYIALKLSGTISTTSTGLSEGIFWDFQKEQPSEELINYFGFDKSVIPPLVPIFGLQGTITAHASLITGIPKGVPITYRAGDQPNNALSLNVFEPGEVAATAGTSGVIYGILDHINHDPLSRVNIFAHVNHLSPATRLGVLLCVNGTGSLYSWLKRLLGEVSYEEMNRMAEGIPAGSDGLTIFPFGNGVERIHQNQPFGGRFMNLDFNRHTRDHMIRAAKEGIVYALNYGFEAMQEMGVQTKTVRAGHSNMFLSDLFCRIFASVTGTTVELYDTDGATGAARAAGLGAGIFQSTAEAFRNLRKIRVIQPEPEDQVVYKKLYSKWKLQMINKL